MNNAWILPVIILLSSIPVFVVYVWFRRAKYQFTLVWFLAALLAGAAAFFPALFLQNILGFAFFPGSRQALFFHYFIRIAFTEELSRLLIFFIFFWVNKRFSQSSWNNVKKGAAVGLVAGIGFAVLENAIYGAADVRLLLLRAITAAPLHAACGSRVGIAAILFRTNPVQATFRFFAAVAIHGIYNLMITIPGLPSIAAIFVALSALVTSILTIRGGWSADELPANQ